MEGEEKNVWEDLVEETGLAATWAGRLDSKEEAGPLLVTKQLLASQMMEESEWLQRRAATGKTKSKDLAEIAVLKEHQLCVETTIERYGKILWRNGGSILEPLRGLALAITRTNRQMIETIERARKKVRRSKRRRRGDTPPPRWDSRGRTRSARSQVPHTPEEDPVQGREISYSPVTEEDDVEERAITQDVPYINKETERIEIRERNEETERIRESEGNKESRSNDEVDRFRRSEKGEEPQRTGRTGSTVNTEIYEDTQRVQETKRSVEMGRNDETDQTMEDEPMRTEEPVELENLDPEGPMGTRESEPRGSTRRPKRLCDYQDPQEPERLMRLEGDESTPEVDHRQCWRPTGLAIARIQ